MHKRRRLLNILRRVVSTDEGFALLSITLIMGLVLSYMVLMLDSQTVLNRSVKFLEQSMSAQQIAEAGIQKAVHCIKIAGGGSCPAFGIGYVGETNTVFGDGSFTVTITGTSTTRIVTSTGTAATGRVFTVRTEVTVEPNTVTTPGFNYAIQAGDLGAIIENNAEVSGGPIRSGDDVECSNGAEVNHAIYVTRPGGMIYNCDDIPEAHADIIRKTSVAGDAYYRSPSDFIQSSASGAKFPYSPTPDDTPLPSFDLDFWHAAAESGGVIEGNYSPADNSALGPIRINGDLTLGNDVDVVMTGPIWVNGNVSLSNNATLILHPSFGGASGVMLADTPANRTAGGFIDVSNNVTLGGSGTDGSYLLVVSANSSNDDDNPALSVSNNAGEGIFYAPFGTVRIQNNAEAIAAIGRRVYIDQNAAINFDNTGATPADMVSATTGSGTWLMRPGTWREVK